LNRGILLFFPLDTKKRQNSELTVTSLLKFKSMFESMKAYFAVKGRWDLERFIGFICNVNISSLTSFEKQPYCFSLNFTKQFILRVFWPKLLKSGKVIKHRK